MVVRQGQEDGGDGCLRVKFGLGNLFVHILSFRALVFLGFYSLSDGPWDYRTGVYAQLSIVYDNWYVY